MAATETAGIERVLQRLSGDDSADREIVLVDDVTGIGRATTGFAFPDDADMADLHAEIRLRDDTVVVRDSGEGSGVWLRVVGSEGRLLRPGDQVWLGAQIIVIRHEVEGWQVRHHGPDGRLRETHALPPAGVLIGRASEWALDPSDSRLSRRHAQLVPEGDDLRLYDRGAHNGTYVKLVTEEPLVDGDEFRLANCRFRYVARDRESVEASLESAEHSEPSDQGIEAATVVFQPGRPAEDQSTPPVEGEPQSSPSALHDQGRRARGLGARLKRMGRRVVRKRTESDSRESSAHREESQMASQGNQVDRAASPRVLIVIDSDEGSVSIETSAGKTVLEAVQEAGLERGAQVDWECRDGGCGVCVVGVVEGADRMDPPDPSTGEMKTIQITEQVVPDPTKYRLACLARVRGTVRLRKL